MTKPQFKHSKSSNSGCARSVRFASIAIPQAGQFFIGARIGEWIILVADRFPTAVPHRIMDSLGGGFIDLCQLALCQPRLGGLS
jgi:hypothetical protein